MCKSIPKESYGIWCVIRKCKPCAKVNKPINMKIGKQIKDNLANKI